MHPQRATLFSHNNRFFIVIGYFEWNPGLEASASFLTKQLGSIGPKNKTARS